MKPARFTRHELDLILKGLEALHENVGKDNPDRTYFTKKELHFLDRIEILEEDIKDGRVK